VPSRCCLVRNAAVRWRFHRASSSERSAIIRTRVSRAITRRNTCLEDEPAYDPNPRLALDVPPNSTSLAELGYGPGQIARCVSSLAIIAPVRVLSSAGCLPPETVGAHGTWLAREKLQQVINDFPDIDGCAEDRLSAVIENVVRAIRHLRKARASAMRRP